MGCECSRPTPEGGNPEVEEPAKHVEVPGSDERLKILGVDDEYPFVERDHNLESVMQLFEKKAILGQGASSEVAHVIRKGDNREFAMKIMKRDDKWNPILFKQEYELLTQLNHPNILGYCDCYMDRKNFYFCTELCKGGELFDKIKEYKKFSEVQAALFIKTIISAIEHCHERNIVHRDLKPENIVFRTKEHKELVIIDFGDARVVKKDDTFEDFVGTAFYLAPECVRNRTGEELKKSDMWTIGVITYVLLTGRPPFYGRDNKEILRKIIRGKVTFSKSTKLSSSAKDFIKKLIRKNPGDRLSAKEALGHRWLQGSAGTEDLGRDLVESISNYSSVSKLKKVLVRMLANQMTKSDHRALRHQFDKMDTNGDGVINLEELTDYLYRQSGNREEAKATATNIIAQLDQDGDGQISKSEWWDARLATKFQDDSIIKQQFDMIDDNGDGYITHDELAKLFNGQLTEDLISQMIQEVDENNDGKISFEEFVVAMKEGCLKEMLSPKIKNQMSELRKEFGSEEKKEE
jgi:calcium-dependent protein kinase